MSIQLMTLKFFMALNAVGLPLTLAQEKSTADSTIQIKLASEIDWQHLNPARGDKSPQAGTIWGDQTKDGESGFLVKFVDGFSSPPHIHNITYRGIVLGGGLHNDDPEAEPMWMKVGSYWTQPAGEVHITSARGSSIAYVEIQSGPYLVKPPREAFDNGERPVNVESSNTVWLDASNTSWIRGTPDPNASKNPRLAFLWGEPTENQINGTMTRLPAGFSGKLDYNTTTLKVIVINGEMKLRHGGDQREVALSPGSYIGAQGKSSLNLSCANECTFYVRTKGSYQLIPDGAESEDQQ